MTHLLEDFKPGPLEEYRKRASFDWKKLKVFLDTEEIIEFQNVLYDGLKNNPLFKNDLLAHGFDDERRLTSLRSFFQKNWDLIRIDNILGNLKKPTAVSRTMIQASPSSHVKCSVGNGLFISAIMSMGTRRHAHFLDEFDEDKIFGCLCLTEIGHGSNAKGMQTSATYDPKTEEFILHSPSFEAAKCWTGSLGQSATHTVVYAQLYTKNQHQGIHAFVVPIRDRQTLLPFPGVIVGDMGQKIGLNGIDNGFMLFENYRIPRENLLNKVGDVTKDGTYVTSIKDPRKKFGAALRALSFGRVNITTLMEAMGNKALTIAIRYAAVRKQFGPENQPEISILEYQSHQHRLLPFLAAGFCLRIFGTYLMENQYQFTIESIIDGGDGETLPERSIELHGISSASKPVAGWVMRDAIQESRECCGGHGYLKASGLGDIRNDHDANLTYDGENHVLIQQCSNWLLKFWPQILKREKISSPMQSTDFLSNGLQILQTHFVAKSLAEIREPQNIMSMYDWLVCYLLKQTYEKQEAIQRATGSTFNAQNNSQVYFAKTLGIAYMQRFILQRVQAKIFEADDVSIRNVLTRVFALYGLWSLEKHVAYFYQGGYSNSGHLVRLLQEAVLQLCAELKDDAVSLVDVVAPPDFILNSVLGQSDGEVYKHLQSAMYRSPYTFSRPSWWQDVVHPPKSKL